MCLFEQSEEESVLRISNRRIDPTTGIFYNLEVSPPKDETTASRMIELVEDKEEIVRKRILIWNSQISNIEEAFKAQLLNVLADKKID